MGSDNSTTTTESRATATPEEQELNRLQLDMFRANAPQLQALQAGNLALGTDAIAGLQTGASQSPIINRLLAGISPEVTQGIVTDAIGDVRTGLNQSGLLDSGIRQELEASTSADIRRASEESNLNTLFNLFNLAQGQGAQIQSPVLGQAAQLGSQLAGLRSTSGTSTQTSMNPFLRSFQSSLGKGLGMGTAGFIGGGSSAFGSALGGGATGGVSPNMFGGVD